MCSVFKIKLNQLKEVFFNSNPKESRPFELIHIDHYGPVDSSRAIKYILVVVDGFTKFLRLYATKSTSTRQVLTALKEAM